MAWRLAFALDCSVWYTSFGVMAATMLAAGAAWGKLIGVREPVVQVERWDAMLRTVAVVLLILWVLGLVSGYTIGAFIHVLLVIAIVLFLVGLVSGRRVV